MSKTSGVERSQRRPAQGSRNTFSRRRWVVQGLAAAWLGRAVLCFIGPGGGHRGGRVCLTAGQGWGKIFSWKCGEWVGGQEEGAGSDSEVP